MQIQLHDLSKEECIQQIQLLTKTIYNNPYIPHKPFDQQIDFLTYPSEELLYGGMAGGGKSDAILMSALQYVGDEYKIELEDGRFTNPYSALILRRTYQDLSQPNAIMDRAKRWLDPFTKNRIVKWDGNTKTFTFPSGATLTFGYLSHDNDLDQYQGSEFQFVGFDELTQFTERQYTYLHSRLRRVKKSNIPIRMRAGTNPGGRGHDWVKKKFILGDVTFIPSSYLDNIHLDTVEYTKSLEKLDELTKRQLMHGDWDAVITKGLLINLERLHQNVIRIDDTYKPVFSTIGIDPAGSGTDKFSVSLLTYFTNDRFVLMDLMATPDNDMIEEHVRNFIIRNLKYNPVLVNFEREPGSRSEDALKYWISVLADLFNENQIMDTPASNTGSKYNRARPHANLVKEDKLFFNEELLSDNVNDYNPLNSLFNQYVYVHPKKEVMKEFSSPDELDSMSYANIAMDDLLNNQSNITVGARIGA